jgi:hypothetical protein
VLAIKNQNNILLQKHSVSDIPAGDEGFRQGKYTTLCECILQLSII